MEPTRDAGHRTGLAFVILITLLLSGSVFIHGFMTRILGLTMVCMVDPSNLRTKNASEEGIDSCGRHYTFNATADKLGYSGTFKWNSVNQATVVSIHNWARLVFLPVSGFIIKLGNPSQIFAVATLVCALVTVCFPTAAMSGGWLGASVVRFFLGAAHAFSSPCLDHLVASKTPKSIRSIIYAVITSGSQMAVIIGNPLGAFFCREKWFFGGWPAIFYTSSIAAGIWILCWEALHVYLWNRNRRFDKPARGIMRRENQSDDGSGQTMVSSTGTEAASTTRRVRYKLILKEFWENVVKEKAVWALYPCNIAATWTITLLIYYIPQFYRDVLKVSLANNGYFSALPFLILMLSKLVFSAVADWMKRSTSFSSNLISKSFNTLGMAGSGAFILLTTTIPCLDPPQAITLLCVGAGLYSAVTPGFRVSLVCINKEWTGCISAACTIVAMIAGSLFPFLVGGIVKHGTIGQWNTLFSLMAGADILAALVYIRFGSIESKEDRELALATATASVVKAD